MKRRPKGKPVRPAVPSHRAVRAEGMMLAMQVVEHLVQTAQPPGAQLFTLGEPGEPDAPLILVAVGEARALVLERLGGLALVLLE